MATEADILEPVSLMEREVNIHLKPGEFDHPPETADLVKSGHVEVPRIVQVEATHCIVEAKAAVSEGVNFLESPSIAKVHEHEIRETQETSQVDEIPCQAEKEIPESEKQTKTGGIFKAAEETGSKECEVLCVTEELADKEELSHHISDATSTSLKMDKNEETFPEIDGEKTSRVDGIMKNIGANKQDLVEENLKSIDRETLPSDSHKEEEGRRNEEEDAKLKTSKDTGILEASLCPTEEALVHTSENLDSHIETHTEACLDNEDKGPDLAQGIRKIEKEKEGFWLDETEEGSSAVATHLDSQNEEEASSVFTENVEEKLDTPSVTLATDKSSTRETRIEVPDKLEENFSVASELESHDINNSIENHMTPFVDETAEKNSSGPQTEKTCLQEVDKTEMANLVSETLPSDSHKEEEGRRNEEEDAKLKTSEDTGILEASLAPTEEALVHTSENSDSHIATHTEACLDNEDEGHDLEKEKESIWLDKTEEGSTVVATCLDGQNEEEEASSAIIENVEEKLDTPSLALARDKSSTQETVIEVTDKLEENFILARKVESKDINNSNENDMTPLVDETEEKLFSAPQTEEKCLQEVDKTEISNGVSETCPESVVKRSQEEECQIETVEKTPETESSEGQQIENEINTEQKPDDEKQNIDEEQAASEALVEDSRARSVHTVVQGKDSISDAVTASQESKDETENQGIQKSFEMVTEEMNRTVSIESETIICAKEDPSIENQEESFDKKEKDEQSVNMEAVRVDGIPKVEDLPPAELHDKTEISEVEITAKNEDELNVIHSLEKEKELGKVSDFETQDQIHETNRAAGDEEEHDDNDLQARDSVTEPSLELPSEKREITIERSSETSETEIEVPEAVHKSDSKEKSETTETEKSVEEDTKEEACETEIHSFPTSDDTEKCHVEEATSDKVASAAFLHDTIDQNIQAASTQEAARPLKDELEENEKATGIINEEVKGEPNIRENVVYLSSEAINKGTVESSQKTKKEADVSEREDTEGVSQKSVEETLIKKTQDIENVTDRSSSEQIFEESETANTVDSIENETNESDEIPDSTLQNSLVKEQESLQGQNLTVQQGSLAKEIDDGGCSIRKEDDKENYTRPAEAEEHNEAILKDEEDSEHMQQKSETNENKEESLNVKSLATEPVSPSYKADKTEEVSEIGKEEITNESNIKSDAQETVAQDLAKNFQDIENSVDTSNEEQASLAREIDDGGCSIKKEDYKENYTRPEHNEAILKDEEDSEHIPQTSEINENNEESSNVISLATEPGAPSHTDDKTEEVAEIEKEEITSESNIKSEAQEIVAQDLAKNFQDIENSVDTINEEASFAKEIDDGGCSIKKEDDKENYTRPAEVEEHNEVMLKDEEDPEHIPQKSETDENKEESSNVISLATEPGAQSHTDDKTEEVAEIEKEEITNESNIKSDAQETVAQDLAKNFQDIKNSTDTSNEEIFEELKAKGTGDNPVHETNQNDERPSEIISTPPADKTDSSETPETSASDEYDTATENQKESIEKGEAEEKPIDFDANRDNEIQKIEKLPSTELNDRTETAEVEISEKNIDELNEKCLVEQDLREPTELDSQDQVHKENEAAGDEEKHDENDSQAFESTNTNVEHPFALGEVTTEPSSETDETNLEKQEPSPETNETNLEKPEMVEELDSGEKLKTADAEMTIQEDIQKTEEMWETEMNKVPTSDESGKHHNTEEVTSDKLDSNAFLSESVEQNFQATSLHEAPTTLDDNVELIEKTKSGISEEITGISKVIDEQNKVDNITHLSSEVINEETVESTQESEKKADLYKGEDTEEQIIGDINASGISQEPVKEGKMESSQDDESNPEESNNSKIFKKHDTAGTVDCSATEEKQSDESPNLVKEQESQQSQDQTAMEASSLGQMGEDGCSIEKEEDNENHTGLAEVEEHHEETLKGEEDLEQALQKNETEENIEQPLNVITDEEVVSASNQTEEDHVEEIVESPQCNEREAEIEKEVIIKSNSRSLSEDPVKNYHNDDNDAEKSNTEVFKSEIAETRETQILTEVEDHNEVILKAEDGIEQMLHKKELEEKIEQPSDVVPSETEAEAGASSHVDAVEEIGKRSQCIERKPDLEKGEDIINESSIRSLSQESAADDPFQNDDSSAEKSSTEVSDKSEVAETVDSTVTEAKTSNKSPDIAKEQENQQIQNLTEVKEPNEMIPKDEEGIEQILQKNEHREQTEQPLNVIDTETEAGASSQTDAAEDIDKRSQCIEGELEKEKGEDCINESNIRSLSHESAAEDPFQNDDSIAEKSNTEVSEIAETVDGIVNEAKVSDESPHLAEELENQQTQDLIEVEKHTEVILKDKEGIEQILQKNEAEENIEQPLNVISAKTEVGASSQTDDIAGEDRVERTQNIEREIEIEKVEDDINESNVKSLSHESVAEDSAQNDDNSAEKPNTHVSEKSEIPATVDGIVTEAEVSHESTDSVKEQENQQITAAGDHNEVILKDEEGIKQILQKSEPEENIEQPLHAISAETEAGASSQTEGTAVEDASEMPQCNERETEIEKSEDFTNERNLETLSQQSVAEDTVQNDDSNAEKSSREIFEKSETTETLDTIVTEVKQSDEINNLVTEHEILQSQNAATPDSTSVKETDEDGSSIKKEDRETNTEIAGFEQSEVLLTGEKYLEQTLEKNEYETNESIEPLKVISPETDAVASSSLSDDNTVEGTEIPHCNEPEVEMPKDENVINEASAKSLSQESLAEDLVRNLQNDDSSAKKSISEILGESEAARTDENISHQTNQSYESLGAEPAPSLAKEVESLQDKDQNVPDEASVERTPETVDYLTHETIVNNKSLDSPLQAPPVGEQESIPNDNTAPSEASTMDKKDESISSPKAVKEDENNSELEEIKLQGEKETSNTDLEQVLQKLEQRENPERSIVVPPAEREESTLSEVSNNPAEEIDESSQNNLKEAGMPREVEDTKEHIIDEQNFESVSEEVVEQGHSCEVSNKEICESEADKTGESIALEMNQNNESTNASHPVVLIQEEQTPEDKNIDLPEALPDEKEDDGSSFRASEDNDSKTNLSEVTENSRMETSHGKDKKVLELQKKEPGELLESSPDENAAETKADDTILKPDEIAAETKADDVAIRKGVDVIQTTEETLQKEKEGFSKENLEPELQKNEPGKLPESSPDAITGQTESSKLSDDGRNIEIPDEVIAIQNTEEMVQMEKIEENDDIDGCKVEKVPTTEDLKPVAETCDPSTSNESRTELERSMTSEMEAETAEKAHGVDSEEKLECIEMSETTEEETNKGDIEEVDKDITTACLNEETKKHIQTEDDATTDLSPQSAGEETTLIYDGYKAGEKPKLEMPEELEPTSTVEDDEKEVVEEVNIEKDHPTEPAVLTEVDVTEVGTKTEMHQIIQSADDEDIREQTTERSEITEDNFEVPLSRIDPEGPLDKEEEDENDKIESKEKIEGFNSEITEEIAGRFNEPPKDSDILKDIQEPDGVCYQMEASDQEIQPVQSTESLLEKPSLEFKSKEENLEKSSASIKGVTEETRFGGDEQEDKRQLNSSAPETQEKETITAHTKETLLDSEHADTPKDDASNLVENRDHEIPEEADGEEEDIEHEIQHKSLVAGSEDQNVIGEEPSEKISDDNLIEHSEMSSNVSNLVATEEIKPTDENIEIASISSQAMEPMHSETSHGENIALEFEKKEPEQLESSPDVIAAETKADDITIPKEVDVIQTTKETLQKEKDGFSEENLEPEPQKKEPGKLLESSSDVISEETEAAKLSDKDRDIGIRDEDTPMQNTEEMVDMEKIKGNDVIDGSKFGEVPTTEDLKPVAETCDTSTSKESENEQERFTTSDMEGETNEKTYVVESVEKLAGKEMSETTEEKIKGNVGEVLQVDRNITTTRLNEDTKKHITTEDDTTTDVSPQSAGEETALIKGDKDEEKPEMEMHEVLELTSTVEDNEKQVLEEVNIEYDCPTEPAALTEDDVREVGTISEMHETMQSADDEDTGKWIAEKNKIMDNFEAPVSRIDRKPLEKVKEDENGAIESREKIEGFNPEITEEIAEIGNEVPNDSNTLKDIQEPDVHFYPVEVLDQRNQPVKSNESLVEKLSSESKSKESLVNSAVMEVTEGTSIEGVEQEKRQLDSSGPETQEKEQITVDTEETILDSVHANAPHDASNLVENKDHEIPAEAEKDEEEVKHEIQNNTLVAGSEDQNAINIGEMPSKKISDDNLIEHSEMSSEVSKLVAIEEPIDETTKDSAVNETEFVSISSQAVVPMRNEYENTTSEEVSESGFADTRIAHTTEQAGPYQNEDLNQDLHTAQNISKPEYVETSKIEETAELVRQQEICQSKTSGSEESANVGDETLESSDSTNVEMKEAAPEDKDLTKKSEASLEEHVLKDKAMDEIEAVVEKGDNETVKLEAMASKCEVETTEIKSCEFPTEEKFGSAESSKKFDCTSEIVTKDLSNEDNQEIHPDKVEETSISESVEQGPQESQQKTEEKTELKFAAEDDTKETRNTEETIKPAILTEEVKKEIDRANGDEVVNQFNKEENDLKDLNAVSTGDERVDEATESSSVSIEKLTIDSNGKTETESLMVQETQTTGSETLNTKGEEEIEVEDEKSVDVSTIAPKKDSEELIKEQIIEETDGCYDKETTTVAEVTTESNLEEVHTEDKSVEVSIFASNDSDPHTVETEASQQDRIVLEENSSNLASQLATDDHENVKQDNEAMKSADADGIEESKMTSDVVCISSVRDVEELHAHEIKDEIKEDSEMAQASQGEEIVAKSEVAVDQTVSEETTKEHEIASLAMTCKEEYETKASTENLEHNMEKVSTSKDDSPENSAASDEKLREFEDSQLDLDGNKGIENSPSKEHEDKGGNTDDIEVVSETEPKSKCHGIEADIEDEVTGDQTLREEKSEEQYQKESFALPSKEQDLGSSTKIEKTEENITGEKLLEDQPETTEEVCLRKEERELQFCKLELDSLNEGQKEARGTSVEIEEKKDASEFISVSRLQNQTSLGGVPSKEQEHGISITGVGTVEKKIGAEVSEDAQNLTEEATLPAEEPIELKPFRLEPQLENDGQETKSLEDVREVEFGIPDQPLKLQPERKNEKSDAPTLGLEAEENKSISTTEATEFMLTEVTKEQIKETKDDAKDGHATSIAEAVTEESHRENQLMGEESLGEKILTKEMESEVISTEIEKTNASERIDKQTTIEKGTAENLHHVVDNEKIKENIPDEAGGATVEEAIYGGGRIGSTTATEKKQISASLVDAREEKASDATLEGQIPREAEWETVMSVITKDVPQELQGPIAETAQEHGTENVIKTAEPKDSAKHSLFDMMQRSTRERQEAAELTGEKEATEETEKATKSDEEEVEEHEAIEEDEEHKKNNDSGSDAPALVEAARDVEMKITTHKKSHNILSGVGSKVKHSIIKVKKAITGKSSHHSKQHSPK